jgi:hypothetical protein
MQVCSMIAKASSPPDPFFMEDQEVLSSIKELLNENRQITIDEYASKNNINLYSFEEELKWLDTFFK